MDLFTFIFSSSCLILLCLFCNFVDLSVSAIPSSSDEAVAEQDSTQAQEGSAEYSTSVEAVVPSQTEWTSGIVNLLQQTLDINTSLADTSPASSDLAEEDDYRDIRQPCSIEPEACSENQHCCSTRCVGGSCCLKGGDYCVPGDYCCSGICDVSSSPPLGTCRMRMYIYIYMYICVCNLFMYISTCLNVCINMYIHISTYVYFLFCDDVYCAVIHLSMLSIMITQNCFMYV
eukprot:GHVQ01011038.1.p2 GENE.GHVQ01011038.1~~GHVQ01011038.1.p2  ORF type:complete len:231 (+),score=33.65 GHVQ01011038.1:142-834(+)